MTALDRAFIKAYHRPSLSHSGTAVAEPPAATPRAAMGPAVPLSQALAELAVAPAVSPETLSAPADDVRQDEGKAGGEADARSTAAETGMAPIGPLIAALLDEAQAFQATTLTEPAAVINSSAAALAAEVVQTTTAGKITQAEVPIEESTSVPTEAVAVTSMPLTSLPKHAVTVSHETGEARWRPLLQVDRVVWPSTAGRMQTTAVAAVQQMVDGLLSICASGNKVLGLASCVRGEGVTTLLLAAARDLLGRGRKVVLVDADWNNPQLAQSLGLLPQIGWEETLGGGLPLEEVVIESLADGLAVLPVREPSASPIAQDRIAASLDILAREFDVVLVDLGALAQAENESTALPEGGPSRYAAARMDAIILVQDVRVTTPNRLAEMHQGLVASNMRHAGTIQNFVAG